MKKQEKQEKLQRMINYANEIYIMIDRDAPNCALKATKELIDLLNEFKAASVKPEKPRAGLV